jgi:flagellar biosynthesis GTPase FlhF
MGMTVQDLHDLIRLLEEHPDWRAELRRVLLSSELLELPKLVREIAAIQRRHSELLEQHSREIGELRALVAQLVEAQRRTEQRVEELAEAQRRTEQRVEELAEAQRRTEQRVEELAEAQRRNEEQLASFRAETDARFRELAEEIRRLSRTVDRLAEWQRGEAGRREGEQYEQHTLRRAPNLFAGGEGGNAIEFSVRRRISRWLQPYYQEQQMPEPLADPLLADIIWWKGDEVVIAEVSQKVNGQDVRRAKLRANTLREVGVQAMPVVIGEEWATPESQALAQQEGVEWMVGGGVSQGFLRFRRIPSEPPSETI